MQSKKPKFYTPDAALLKLQQYCAYQERSHQEVRAKLRELFIKGDDLENIIARLIEDNYLNEERFAKAYAGGKFRIKRWGRIRIMQELKMRHISEYCIRQAMLEFNDEDYQKAIKELIAYKVRNTIEPNVALLRQKVGQYIISRGFESELVWEALRYFPNDVEDWEG